MSVTTPTSEDDEIHDLVLMFANSRIPRGSDAFQTILDDLRPLKEEEDDEEEDPKTDVFDSGNKEQEVITDIDSKSESPEQQHVRFTAPNLSNNAEKLRDRRSVRMVSPKATSHVHWPNAERDIASSPTASKLHHARLYVKTVPAKPILKHDDDYKDHINLHVHQTWYLWLDRK